MFWLNSAFLTKPETFQTNMWVRHWMRAGVILLQLIIVLLAFGCPTALDCWPFFKLGTFNISCVTHCRALLAATVCKRKYCFRSQIWYCRGHISTSYQNRIYILSVSEVTSWCLLVWIQTPHYLSPWEVNELGSLWKKHIFVWHSQVPAILFPEKRILFSGPASLIWVLRNYLNVFVGYRVLQAQECTSGQNLLCFSCHFVWCSMNYSGCKTHF